MVLILADVEEFSYEEISEMMDTPIGTVRSRLHRARDMMRQTLEKTDKRKIREQTTPQCVKTDTMMSKQVHPHGEQLSAYIDGMLDVGKTRGIAEHLRACAPCRAAAGTASGNEDPAARDACPAPARPAVLGRHLPPPARG